MPDLPSNAAHTKRFNAVLAYIDANLKGDLCEDVEPSGELFGVSLPSTIHHLRGRACFRLCTVDAATTRAHCLSSLTDYSVLAAALSAGFESPEAFFRAFGRAFD